jgi:hypothetical protein
VSTAESGQPSGRRRAANNRPQFSKHSGAGSRVDFDQSNHAAWHGNLGEKMPRVLIQVELAISSFGIDGGPPPAAVAGERLELPYVFAPSVR